MKKGYTVIELVFVLALMSIILLLGFTFLMGATKNFKRSQENSDMHYQARRASDLIRDEVRFANNISLINISAINTASSNSYLYVEAGSDGLGQLVLQKGTDKQIITSEVIVIPLNFSLTQDSSGNNTLSYSVITRVDNSVGMREYSVPTTIFLNNIKEFEADSGECIQYTKP